MSYFTKNEIDTFDFSASTVGSIIIKENQAIINVEDVIIAENNSQNKDIRKMGTNELTLVLKGITEVKFIKDGFIIRDMDDKVRTEEEDRLLTREEYLEVLQRLPGCPVDSIIKQDGYYGIYIDTDEPTEGYSILIFADSDEESWERFRNLPEEYKM